MSPRPIQVRVTGDSSGAVVAINRTEQEIRELDQTAQRSTSGLGKLKAGLLGLGGAILAGGALREGFGIIKESVGLASSLTETVSKTEQIFGKSSAGIQKWAKTTDVAMSLSQKAILDTVDGFKLLLDNKGLSGKQSTEWAKNLTSLAGDLSSFFDTSASDAAQALSSALRGEMDPIEKFGVSLDEATLKAEAYAQGLYSGKGALSANAKAQAAYAQILKQTSKAQGDLSRTQDSASNQMRQFKVNVEGLKTTLGTAFIPLIEEYLPGINEGLKGLNNEKAAKELGEKFLRIAKTIETDVIPKLKELGGQVKDSFSGVDTEALKGSLSSLETAAGNIARGVGNIFEAFSGLSPETQANIATIVAAGTALGVLTKKNPVIKIGVDLVAGAVGTIAEALLSRMFRGVQDVRVTNFPRFYPDGESDGDGTGKGKGKGAAVAGGAGKAGLAALAASLLPMLIDKIPLSPGIKDFVTGISEAGIAALLVPGGPVGKAIAAITVLTAKYGRVATLAEGTQVYAMGLNKKIEGESTTRKDADQKQTVYAMGLNKDIVTETGRRASGDAYLNSQLAKTNQAVFNLARTFRRFVYYDPRTGGYILGGARPTAAATSTTNNYYSFTIPGAGSPEVTARAIERHLRRAGDRSRVSVTG